MFMTRRRIQSPFLPSDTPAEARRDPPEGLQPAPVGVPRPDEVKRLGEALLRIVLHASRRVTVTKGEGAVVVRAVPEHLIDEASELLAELGL
jgi:hypothetical protein